MVRGRRRFFRNSLFLLASMAFAASSLQQRLRAVDAFADVTEAVGLKGLGGGVAAWVDYDADGWVDLWASGQLWRNIKGEKFERAENQPAGGAGIWADIDNDGYPDLFCWEGTGRLSLNRKGKSFEDITKNMPPLPTKISLGAVSGDFDGDGLVDFYVGGYEIWAKVIGFPDVIYRNLGKGKFEESWRTKARMQPGRGITAADFDEDGDLDIYISNYRLQPNLLWQNDGKGNLADVATPFGTAGDGGLGAWGHTIGSSWGDFDNDGHLDLFVGNFSHPPAYQDRPKFLRNKGPAGKFHFEDKSAAAGLRWQESYASPALGDFDNDGLLDLFFTTVYGGNRSVLYRNTGNWKFEEIPNAAGMNTEKTYQGAWGDFNGDGYLDLVTGGKLFRNPGGDGNWIKVQLVGKRKVNRSAIGSQVRIRLGDKVLVRQVDGATGQGNQNDSVLHFGLGKTKGPVLIEVRWSNGHVQKAKGDINKTVKIICSK